jgi:hypothetical protein
MKARLLAVQRTLYVLIAASMLVSVVALPRGRNRDYMLALEELKAFQAAFDQKKLEQSLLGYAQNQGAVQLEDIAKRVRGPGVPALTAAAKAQAITPRAQVQLDTLGAVVARVNTASDLPIGVVGPDALAEAIAWRLSRLPDVTDAVLTEVSLLAGDVSDADAQREHSVAQARLAAREADAIFEAATAKLAAAEELYANRRKWKASWKMMLKADEARKEARVALDAAQADKAAKHAAYEQGARSALAVQAKGEGDTSHAVAQVELTSGARKLVLQVPVTLETRRAALPSLKGIGLTATREAGLWDEVKDKTAAQAIDVVHAHFTWHYRYVEPFGMRLGGMTLLHLLPIALPVILFLLLLRIRRVSVSYNPFGAVELESLPRVGLGPRALDALVLSILPFVAAVLTMIALIAISEIPVLPLLSGFLALGLGAYVFIELGALQSLTDAVARSHSTPPPRAR